MKQGLKKGAAILMASVLIACAQDSSASMSQAPQGNSLASSASVAEIKEPMATLNLVEEFKNPANENKLLQGGGCLDP